MDLEPEREYKEESGFEEEVINENTIKKAISYQIGIDNKKSKTMIEGPTAICGNQPLISGMLLRLSACIGNVNERTSFM